MKNSVTGKGIRYKEILTRRENGLTITSNDLNNKILTTIKQNSEVLLELRSMLNWKHSYKRI